MRIKVIHMGENRNYGDVCINCDAWRKEGPHGFWVRERKTASLSPGCGQLPLTNRPSCCGICFRVFRPLSLIALLLPMSQLTVQTFRGRQLRADWTALLLQETQRQGGVKHHETHLIFQQQHLSLAAQNCLFSDACTVKLGNSCPLEEPDMDLGGFG